MTTKTQTDSNNAKICAAIELLNEAAKDKTDELNGVIGSKYSHIREAMTAGAEHGQEIFKHVKNLAEQTISGGKEKVGSSGIIVDKDPASRSKTGLQCGSWQIL